MKSCTIIIAVNEANNGKVAFTGIHQAIALAVARHARIPHPQSSEPEFDQRNSYRCESKLMGGSSNFNQGCVIGYPNRRNKQHDGAVGLFRK